MSGLFLLDLPDERASVRKPNNSRFVYLFVHFEGFIFIFYTHMIILFVNLRFFLTLFFKFCYKYFSGNILKKLDGQKNTIAFTPVVRFRGGGGYLSFSFCGSQGVVLENINLSFLYFLSRLYFHGRLTISSYTFILAEAV